MRIGALISIRDKSTRFPGKVLKNFQGQSATGHLIDRVKLARGIDAVIISTSVDPRDKIFDGFAAEKGIEVFHGSEDDKLKRYFETADHFGLDGVVIIDGDDILCFPEIIERTAQGLRSKGHQVVFWKDLPLGAASSGLTRAALAKVLEMKDESDTEVWGGYFTKEGLFNLAYIYPEEDILRHPEIRMTLDYEEDLEFFKAVFGDLYPANPNFSSFDVMDLLVNRAPEITRINSAAQARYESNLKKAAPVKFKESAKI